MDMAQPDSHAVVRRQASIAASSGLTDDCSTSDPAAQHGGDERLRAVDMAVDGVESGGAAPLASTSAAPLATTAADRPRSTSAAGPHLIARESAAGDAADASDVEAVARPRPRSRPLLRVSAIASTSSSWPRSSSRTVRASSVPLSPSDTAAGFQGYRSSHGARARLALETSSRQETRIRQRKLERQRHSAVKTGRAVILPVPIPVPVEPIAGPSRPRRGPLEHHHLITLHQIHLPRPVFAGSGPASRAELAQAITTPITVPALVPPITRSTLRELDLSEVLRNPQLRHDVVFDQHLLFRPNYDGERGQRKRQTAERYWTAIGRELGLGCRCTAFVGLTALPCVCEPGRGEGSIASRLPSRVPGLVIELRQILCSLLPAPAATSTAAVAAAVGVGPEQQVPLTQAALLAQMHAAASSAAIEAALDADLIGQQLEHGLLDLAQLAHFIGHTLKLHCAPMRDNAVDSMVACVAGPDPARGLRMCFELLELMKLDIANHQTRSLRPFLLESAVDFELRSFADMSLLRARRLDLSGHSIGLTGAFIRTRTWLLAHLPAPDEHVSVSPQRTRIQTAVRDGIVDLALAGPSPRAMPESILLDASRIAGAHIDLTDLTVVYALVMLARQLGGVDLDALKSDLVALVTEGSLDPATASVHAHGPLFAGGGSVSAAVSAASSSVGGIGKLESARWRDGPLADALLHIAARVGGGGRVPGQADLELVTGWADRHLRLDAPLFLTLQARLRTAVIELVQSHLDVWSVSPRAASPSSSSVEVVMAAGIGPVSSTALGLGLGPSSLGPDRSRTSSFGGGGGSRKRSRSPSGEHGRDRDDDKRVRRQSLCGTATTTTSLRASGLSPLEPELRTVAERIARVAAFHTRVYGAWYARLIDTPDADVVPAPPSSPLAAALTAAAAAASHHS